MTKKKGPTVFPAYHETMNARSLREILYGDTDARRRAEAEAQAVQLAAKAEAVKPMRHYATDWTQWAAELRAAQQQPDAPTSTRSPRMKP